jgi:hypothetical protein
MIKLEFFLVMAARNLLFWLPCNPTIPPMKLSHILAATLLINSTQAAVTILAEQDGADFVISFSGTINTGSAVTDGGQDITRILPAISELNFGMNINPRLQMTAVVAGSLGSMGPTDPTSISGDPFLVTASAPYVAVLPSYVSGAPIAGSMTFANSNLADIGLSPSSAATWFIGNGATFDTVSFSVVPEPTTGLLTGLASLALLGIRRRR